MTTRGFVDPSTKEAKVRDDDLNTAIDKLTGSNGYAPTITAQTNGSVISAGSASNGTTLVASTTPYTRAIVIALKRGSASHQIPTDNTGTVYIGTSDDCRDSVALTQGSSWELPPNCDLVDFYLMVASANDGVIVVYTV